MKILYIHGYQSSPVESKVNILKDQFGEVFAPFIDWDNDETRPNLFNEFVKLINEENITHVIGSSMGGQMAFYLATFCNIKGLCFNPAFGYRYTDLNLSLNKDFTSEILITLGINDDVIPNSVSTNFLFENNISEKVSIEYLEIGHQINTDIFETQSKKIK
jgi:esterase/lipase